MNTIFTSEAFNMDDISDKKNVCSVVLSEPEITCNYSLNGFIVTDT